MEDFLWRTWARVVAYVELVLMILASMGAFLITILAGIGTTLVVTDERANVMNDWFGRVRYPMVVIWWIWLVVGSLILVTGLQLWAALKLLSATEFGMDVYEALDKARIWRNVTFAFVVLEVVGVAAAVYVFGVAGSGAVGYVMAEGIIYLLWRGSFMFVVYQYMKELETALASVGVGGAENGYIYPDRVFVK